MRSIFSPPDEWIRCRLKPAEHGFGFLARQPEAGLGDTVSIPARREKQTQDGTDRGRRLILPAWSGAGARESAHTLWDRPGSPSTRGRCPRWPEWRRQDIAHPTPESAPRTH